MSEHEISDLEGAAVGFFLLLVCAILFAALAIWTGLCGAVAKIKQLKLWHHK